MSVDKLIDKQDQLMDSINFQVDRSVWNMVLELLEVTRKLDCVEFGEEYDG